MGTSTRDIIIHYRNMSQLSLNLVKLHTGSLPKIIFTSQLPLRPFTWPHLGFRTLTSHSMLRAKEEVQDTGPVKFTTSPAYRMSGGVVRQQNKDDTFAYQPLIVSVSVLSLLIYFCILREESDVDDRLIGNLYDQVDGLEKQDLTTSIRYYEQNGLDSRDLKKRLAEVLQEEEEKMRKKVENKDGEGEASPVPSIIAS